ncbi:MAG: putative spermidine/putrescine transport system substrate-binding protein, partial [Actinomycetota bacterium]|nr:putative spermidine/putrescine transport system substrate-binding protein [Actinomycetota bacterium]
MQPGSRVRGWRACALLIAALALTLAACGSSSKNGSPSNTSGTQGLSVPTKDLPVLKSIGKGEGKVNIIVWEGYAEKEWVKPFETQTGCKVNAKYAGTSSEMVSLMANGGGGQYDLVSASGDADLRLIYGGDVRPVNIDLIPQWKNFHPFLKSPSFNTIDGVHYGVSLEFGPNVLLYDKSTFPTAPTS